MLAPYFHTSDYDVKSKYHTADFKLEVIVMTQMSFLQVAHLWVATENAESTRVFVCQRCRDTNKLIPFWQLDFTWSDQPRPLISPLSFVYKRWVRGDSEWIGKSLLINHWLLVGWWMFTELWRPSWVTEICTMTSENVKLRCLGDIYMYKLNLTHIPGICILIYRLQWISGLCLSLDSKLWQ